jgi:hypothetical protein
MSTMTLVCSSAILLILSVNHVAEAKWICWIRNAEGKQWNGIGQTRASASANAAKLCAIHSKHADNCVMDECYEN